MFKNKNNKTMISSLPQKVKTIVEPPVLKLVLTSLITIFFAVVSFGQFTNVNTTATLPYCPNTSTGSIVVTPTNGTAPYTYQMLSPVVTTPVTQSTAYTYNSLSANTYQIRVTDALGNIQTRTVTLTNPANSDFFVFNENGLVVNECDSIDIKFWLGRTYR